VRAQVDEGHAIHSREPTRAVFDAFLLWNARPSPLWRKTAFAALDTALGYPADPLARGIALAQRRPP
jgi:hypothetical protein